jgi:polysaccharide export outer membrane protein
MCFSKVKILKLSLSIVILTSVHAMAAGELPKSPAGGPITSSQKSTKAIMTSSASSASGTRSASVPATSANDRGVADEYRIGEGDVIQISVWGEPTASVAGVVVRPDGRITVPLIKDIAVSGLTTAEAERIITGKLALEIKSPDVTVIVNQTNSKKVFIIGAVKKEGPIPYTYRMTVMEAISEAGGLTDYAKRKNIYVLRNANGKQQRLPFDYNAALKGQRMELNICLEAGDMLVIPH